MFDLTNDSGLFRSGEQLEAAGWTIKGNAFHRTGEVYLPLYEGKMFEAYNHRAADVVVNLANRFRAGQGDDLEIEDLMRPDRLCMPRWWVRREDVLSALPGCNPQTSALLGFKDITSSTNARTVVVSLLPVVAMGNSVPMITCQGDSAAGDQGCLCTLLNSFVFDFVARQKMANIHLNFFVVEQTPVLEPAAFERECTRLRAAAIRAWVVAQVLELSFTAWDLQPFARAVGYHGPPFRWDEERRFKIRCELDAAFFHLYGIERDGVDYILEIFPVVKRKEIERYGEYRTKRVILDVYDAMLAAMRTGRPYQSTVTPPHQPIHRSPARRAGARCAASAMSDVRGKGQAPALQPKQAVGPND